MPAQRLICDFCGRKFWGRADALYCRERCRLGARMENAKFEIPQIPKSGIAGITFNRTMKRWEVRAKFSGEKRRKYIGAFKNLPDAAAFMDSTLAADS